ncbi:hypothetical protein FB45DRAFT_1034762 [Roridomyces roridus]|uniref:Uncharacterized protein n=1 Tax=Roridomyces roridus TaxID=1738132 RepID=A0AAD7BBJ6_9AGAR|nr:hypothetical protein FB45DRAFT_1034762 [Roridomyces roridus]
MCHQTREQYDFSSLPSSPCLTNAPNALSETSDGPERKQRDEGGAVDGDGKKASKRRKVDSVRIEADMRPLVRDRAGHAAGCQANRPSPPTGLQSPPPNPLLPPKNPQNSPPPPLLPSTNTPTVPKSS